VIEWAAVMRHEFPRLRLLFAVRNAEKRSFAMANYLRREGMRTGVPDLVQPVAIGKFHGLYLEMERRNTCP
jgi:hypothetical protein